MTSYNTSIPRQKKSYIMAVIAVLLTFLSVLSFEIIHSLVTPKLFYGDDILTYTPISLGLFALNLVYKKKYNNIFVLLFPFLYMMTCLLGPITFIRYLYVNISTVAIALFLVIHKDATSSEEALD